MLTELFGNLEVFPPLALAQKLFPELRWNFWLGQFLSWAFELKTFSGVTVENRTFSEVTVEYSTPFKTLFKPLKLDSIPELRWNSHA